MTNPLKVHGDSFCPNYNNAEVLPNEEGNCSLCEAVIVSDFELAREAEDRAVKAEYWKIENMLEAMDDDSDNYPLAQAMEYFCSMYDIREGIKHAIRMTIQDQYNYHLEEQKLQDWKILTKLLETKES